MEKYGRARRDTYDSILRMRIACWITKATYAHSQYLILIFQINSGYANAPQCNIVCTFPVLLSVKPGKVEAAYYNRG